MTTFAIRYSTILAAAIVAVVYSASVHNSTDKRWELLKRIEKEADNLTKTLNENLLQKWVPKIVNGSCKMNVFCLAEEALKDLDQRLGKLKFQEDKTLERLLNQYNKMTNRTKCTLNKNEEKYLKDFLFDLKRCAGHAYNSTR